MEYDHIRHRISENDIDRLKDLIKTASSYKNINYAFEVAIEYGNLQIVELLVEQYNVNINSIIVNSRIKYPLKLAIRSGYRNIIKYLLEKGANPRFFSQTCLYFTLKEKVVNERLSILRFLIDECPIPSNLVYEIEGYNSYTILDYAVFINDFELTKYIVERFYKDKEHKFTFSVLMNNTLCNTGANTLEFIVKKFNINLNEYESIGNSLTRVAISLKNVNVLRYLYNAGARVVDSFVIHDGLSLSNARFNVVRVLIEEFGQSLFTKDSRNSRLIEYVHDSSGGELQEIRAYLKQVEFLTLVLFRETLKLPKDLIQGKLKPMLFG